MSIAGLVAIAAQAPASALIDRSRAKRSIVVAASLAITQAAFVLPQTTAYPAVAAVQVVTGVAAACFPPAIAAMSLGLIGRAGFARRVGRNEAFNHAGNATAAALAGAAGYVFGLMAVFWLMAVMATLSIAAALAIPARAIDHRVACGLDDAGGAGSDQPTGLAVLWSSRPLLIFAGCTTLFHFANAAMLPLVGQKLALANPTLTAACIVAAHSSWSRWRCSPAPRPMPRAASGSSRSAFWCWRCAGDCIPCPTRRPG